MRFPGFSREAAEFLVKSRDVKGIGTDTLSVDPGSSTDFVVHRLLLASGRLIIECLASLDKLPPKGSKLIVAPLSIEGGSGAPARVLAILP
jgi:kynurenine formamidase